ncbi:MAG: hypothetical protein CBARDCOR_6402 [uncultured Caballeronia sp.]|nr:MAG: hypothetical protein CBARDCOR_6402 [uncultured Caballeronia sp.]
MRTARSRTSAENWFDLFAAPFSQDVGSVLISVNALREIHESKDGCCNENRHDEVNFLES